MDKSNILCHYGIKGMRWGIRRYQNKDGTLTPAGRKRAAKLKSDFETLTRRRISSKDGQSSGEKGKTSEPSKKRKSVKDMSDEELKKSVERLALEKRYNELNPKQVSLGEKFVKKVANDILIPSVTTVARNAFQSQLEKEVKKHLK